MTVYLFYFFFVCIFFVRPRNASGFLRTLTTIPGIDITITDIANLIASSWVPTFSN